MAFLLFDVVAGVVDVVKAHCAGLDAATVKRIGRLARIRIEAARVLHEFVAKQRAHAEKRRDQEQAIAAASERHNSSGQQRPSPGRAS